MNRASRSMPALLDAEGTSSTLCGPSVPGRFPLSLWVRVQGSRVIYGQTDSIFCHFPEASSPEAIRMAQRAAALVSSGFPDLMEIKFERVCRPFMLLHVNR